MKTRKEILKITLYIWLLLVAIGASSYYFGSNESKAVEFPAKMGLNITVVLFTLLALYLLKIKCFVYYNKLTTFYFCLYFIGGAYLSIVAFDQSSIIEYVSSIAFGVIKLILPILLWSILYIPESLLERHRRIYLKK